MKSGLTQKQILQKETRMVYLYNKSNTRKIKLCKENQYCWYDCIDEEGYKYELKSVSVDSFKIKYKPLTSMKTG